MNFHCQNPLPKYHAQINPCQNPQGDVIYIVSYKGQMHLGPLSPPNWGEWVGGWVSGWVGEWVGEWVSGWVSEWVSGCEWDSEWVSGQVSEWVGEWVSEWWVLPHVLTIFNHFSIQSYMLIHTDNTQEDIRQYLGYNRSTIQYIYFTTGRLMHVYKTIGDLETKHYHMAVLHSSFNQYYTCQNYNWEPFCIIRKTGSWRPI